GFRRRAPISPNELINAPIQADEAMIVLDAMARLSQMGPEYQANMEIHDDLTFIMPENKIDERAEKIVEVMLYPPFEWVKIVPITVEMSVGDDWYSTKEVEVFASDTYKNSESKARGKV
ncbi:MAG: DNA polymerase, partial [Anaerolineae bacterium]|nr:DNA polymerase [Anaerolineae bacterium]